MWPFRDLFMLTIFYPIYVFTIFLLLCFYYLPESYAKQKWIIFYICLYSENDIHLNCKHLCQNIYMRRKPVRSEIWILLQLFFIFSSTLALKIIKTGSLLLFKQDLHLCCGEISYNSLYFAYKLLSTLQPIRWLVQNLSL